MKRITSIIISIFWITTIFAQEHCVSKPFHIETELFPGVTGELTGHDYFVIYSDSIEFDGLKYKINESSTTPFESKDDLLRVFSCYYDFLNESENISGEYISFQMETEIPRVGEIFQFIHFIDCGDNKQYVYVADGLYKFTNNPFFVDDDVIKLRQTNEAEVIVKYTYNTDTNGLVYFIEEPEFEIVSEQVLVKESYAILEELPNEFEEAHILLYNEISNCENAVFDTIYEEVLVKEGGLSFDIQPAIFGTYIELRAIRSSYEGEGFYERAFQDSLVIQLKSPYVDLIGFEVNSGCNEFDFYDCIKFDFENIPRKDTTVYHVYEKCADGFESAGKYCYSNSGIVPWVFEPREYEKLVLPASTTTIIQPNEYMFISSIRVANKDELDSNCVESVVDSISYQKLVKPATIEETIVPAVYGTVTYKKYQDGGIIEIESGEEDSYSQISTIQSSSYELKESVSAVLLEDKSCYIEAIKLRLIEVEYLNEDDFENLKAFQLAVLNYQIDNDFPLGVIDSYLVNSLNVNFGF